MRTCGNCRQYSTRGKSNIMATKVDPGGKFGRCALFSSFKTEGKGEQKRRVPEFNPSLSQELTGFIKPFMVVTPDGSPCSFHGMRDPLKEGRQAK